MGNEFIVNNSSFDSLEEALFTAPVAAQIYVACIAAGGPHDFADSGAWVQAVIATAPEEVAGTVRQLAVEPLPIDEPDERYVHAVLARLLEVDAARRVAAIKADLQPAYGTAQWANVNHRCC